MKLDIYEDNRGMYGWHFLADDGTVLTDSATTYASEAEAKGAADSVRKGIARVKAAA